MIVGSAKAVISLRASAMLGPHLPFFPLRLRLFLPSYGCAYEHTCNLRSPTQSSSMCLSVVASRLAPNFSSLRLAPTFELFGVFVGAHLSFRPFRLFLVHFYAIVLAFTSFTLEMYHEIDVLKKKDRTSTLYPSFFTSVYSLTISIFSSRPSFFYFIFSKLRKNCSLFHNLKQK